MVLGVYTLYFVYTDSYDVVILCGALTAGHVSPDCLTEFTRITKPGENAGKHGKFT